MADTESLIKDLQGRELCPRCGQIPVLRDRHICALCYAREQLGG